MVISPGVGVKNKDLSAMQLAALGLCTFAFVVIGGVAVLNASGRPAHRSAAQPVEVSAQAR